MKKLRILLADDHAMVREGLRLLINSQPHLQVIGEAGDGREALRKARELKPDIVVMDLTMPELNGLQATENLVADVPGIKVIALTVHEDAHYMRQLIRAGADGYVLKRAAAEQLIEAIDAVAHGGVYFDATLAGKALTVSRAPFPDESHPRSTELSEQETKVLTLLAWGYSNKEVASQLNLSVKTVETYKTRVTEKIGLRSRAEMVRYALRQGWLSDTPPRL
jgi:DNA-binding NarL/FixJ family response regulator